MKTFYFYSIYTASQQMSSLPPPHNPNYLRFEPPKNNPSANGFKLPPLNFSSIQNNNNPNPKPSTMLPFSPSKISRSIYRVDDASPPTSPPPLRRGAASPINCSPVRPIPIRGFREFVVTTSESSSASESSSSSSSTPSPNPSVATTGAVAADDAKPKKYWDIIAAMAAASTYGFAP